jgi:hypothetical protein
MPRCEHSGGTVDWLQFISNIVGALAWPLVAIAILVMVRKQLGPLVERIVELKLPGGAEAKFKEHLAASIEEAEKVALETELAAQPQKGPDKAFLELAKNFPAAAIIQAWKEVEALLQQVRERLPGMQSRHKFDSVVRRLVDQKLIDSSSEKLYQVLRQARNSAVHANEAASISQGEVLEYRDRVSVLLGLLQRVLDQLPLRPAIGLVAG